MSRPTIRIHNSQTNEVIDREMTAAEYAKYEAEKAVETATQAEAETKATAKAALLSKLGITAEEARLLLSE
jgi:hypothetical protein